MKDYSTEEETENEDKAELVTLKYSSQTNLNQSNNQEQEQSWTNVTMINNPESNTYKNMLYCRDQDKYIKLDYSQEEFITKLVDINNLNTNN